MKNNEHITKELNSGTNLYFRFQFFNTILAKNPTNRVIFQLKYQSWDKGLQNNFTCF